MNVRLVLAMTGAVGLSVSTAFGEAETYTYAGDASHSPLDNTAYTNAKYWKDSTGTAGKDGAALDPNGNYVVTDGTSMYTPNVGPTGASYGIFPGKSLSLGVVGGSYGSLNTYVSGTPMTFGSEGLFLNHNSGGIYLQWKPQEIAGDVTVNATAFPFLARYDDTQFTLSGTVHGASTAGLAFRSWWADSPKGFTVRLTGDFSDYLGTIYIGANNYPATACQLGCAELPGSLELRPNSNLSLSLGTNQVSIGTLTIGAGSTLNIGGAYWKEGDVYKGETGRYIVTNAFSATGPVYIAADKNVVVPDGKSHKVAVLTVPYSSTLNKSDFTFVPCLKSCVQVGELVVDEDQSADTKTLSIAFEPVVMLTAHDSAGINYLGASSLTNASHWSDGQLPHAGAHYLVVPIEGVTVGTYKFGTCLHSRSGTSSSDIWSSAYDDVFPGESLTLSESCYLTIACQKFTVKKLRLLDGSGVTAGQWYSGQQLLGAVEAVAGTAKFGSFGGGLLDVRAPVTGSGTVRLCGSFGGVSHPYGTVTFTDLSGLSGKVYARIYSESETGAGNGHWPDYATRNVTLLVGSANGYGGAMDALSYQGVRLENYSRLRTSAGVTVPASSNRGLYINGTYGGVIYTDQDAKANPHVLTLNVPLTLNGSMVKDGPGTLALGGEVRFGTDASTAPTANMNIIEVRAGKLMASSANCLDGVKVAFSNDTQLVVKLDPADEGLATYGFKDVKTTTPFAFLGTMTKLPLAVDASACAGQTAASFTCGLLTVTNTIASSVRAMLPDGLSVKVRGYQPPKLVEIDRPEIGATTFAWTFERGGLLLLVR